MRHFLLLILAFLSLTQPAWAQTPQEKWEGFRTMDEIRDLNLPFMEFAENAVFEFYTNGMTKEPNEDFIVIDIESDEKYKKPTTDLNILNRIDRDPVPFQIETCRKQGLKKCPVLKYTTAGTIFFNKGRFTTCRHLFHNWLVWASRENGNRPIETLSPPILLKNKDKKIIFNSAVNTEPLFEISGINKDPSLNYVTHQKNNYPNQEKYTAFKVSEFMQLRLSKELVEDFKLIEAQNTESITLGKEVYTFGYPAQTKIFNQLPGDAKGSTLMSTNGYVLKYFTEYATFATSNFSYSGNSGAPMISANGEILGTMCTRFNADQTKNNPSLVQSGGQILNLEYLSTFWSQFTQANATN